MAASCSPKPVGNTTAYTEDLTNYRPALATAVVDTATQAVQQPVALATPKPTQSSTAQTEDFIQRVKAYNDQSPYTEGYVIQVYNGTNRDKALQIQRGVIAQFSELNPKMAYKRPTYIIRMGQFTDLMSAQQSYAEVRKEYPSAVLLPEKVRFKN